MFALAAYSQTAPNMVNYQGRLTAQNGSPFSAGVYGIQFRFWDSATAANASDLIWGQQQNVAVQTNGVFNVILGAPGGMSLQGPPPAINDLTYAFTATNRYFGVTVAKQNGTNITSPNEILPRQQLFSMPFAFVAANAANASSVVPGSITSASLANGAVVLSKIANNAIGSAQIANGAVGIAQLAPGVVGSQTFTPTGIFVVPTNVSLVFVTLVGGGGGGGAGDLIIGGDNYGGGGGGAAGFLVNYPVPVTPSGIYTITIWGAGSGAPSGQTGGSPGWSGYPGTSGGNSDFWGLIFAYGGGGGDGASGVNQGGDGIGGSGGSTSGYANLGFTGNSGGDRGGENSFVGGGGGTPFGSGRNGASGSNANGGNATQYGAGGGGGTPSNNGTGKGGNGTSGFAIMRY